MITNATKDRTQKKILFSEEIDRRIDGLTLGLAFIVIGLFLIFVPDYFGNKLVGEIIRWVFIVIGALGLCVEFGKFKPISNIKGFDDLWAGVLLLSVWGMLFLILKNSLWNIAGFFCLVFGMYGTFRGLLRVIYSIQQNRNNKMQSKGTILSDILIFLTKIISLALVVVQLLKAIQQ